MGETGYAQSQGMALLNRLVEEGGPLFGAEIHPFAVSAMLVMP